MEDTLTQFISIINQKNTDASIKNLEVQVGQLPKQLSKHGNTQVNPKEQCKAITTRRGIVVGWKDNDHNNNEEEVVDTND